MSSLLNWEPYAEEMHTANSTIGVKLADTHIGNHHVRI